MKYMYAYRYVFESPKWMANLLAAIICYLVPVVGPIVFHGYGFEMIESLHRRKGARCPDFDTNRLSEYLNRGLWPFLVQLVAGLPIMVIVMVVSGGFAIGMILTPEKHHAVALALGVPLFVFAVLLLEVLASVIVIPLLLRAGLTQEFGQAFSLVFVKDFIKRMWLELILQQLFLHATSIVLSLVGLLACYVGSFVAVGLVAFAQIHIWHQLYELYLERGGTPIPLKPGSTDADEEDLPLVYEEPPTEGIQPPQEP
jgi:hypothetical protein